MKVFKLLLVFFFFCLNAKDNVGVKFFGLSIHPLGEKDNAHLMPLKLDKNGYFVLNIGGVAMYEKFVLGDFVSIKLAQAMYADCATRLGGFSHLGLRGRIIKKGRHFLYGGIGPTLIYRRNWHELPGYVDQHRFKGGSSVKWQYLFLWYGGEFEYKYLIKDNLYFSISFVPGYPDLMNLSLGISCILPKKHKITNASTS